MDVDIKGDVENAEIAGGDITHAGGSVSRNSSKALKWLVVAFLGACGVLSWIAYDWAVKDKPQEVEPPKIVQPD